MAWQNWFVTPPSGKDASFVETVAFNIWANRTSRIEGLINELAAAADPNDEWTQQRAFANAGFNDADDLTDSERSYVESEIAKRWNG